MRYIGVVMCVLLLGGCSSGLQEVGFAIPDSGETHHIVNRSLINDRVTGNQPHLQGGFHCTHKVSSEEMATLRQDGYEHSWYTGCTPLRDHPQHAYEMTSDQPIATLYEGPIGAAFIGAGVGAGLAHSGDRTSVTKNKSRTSNTSITNKSVQSNRVTSSSKVRIGMKQ